MMAPVTELETEHETQQAIDDRHRILIAAAVAALVGSPFRILEINPAEGPSETGWKHCGRIPAATRAVLRRCIPIRTKVAPKEATRETPHHA
jgi:hypothetical protein